MSDAPTCPIHGKALQCPACLGARGGKVMSPKRKRAIRKHLLRGPKAKPREA